ncbi:DUF721 domain-containing protein [Shewanella sp. NIFS-20-20]|uniref:DUF721 domain-containing protein n=1 Tax=Shewanella sp. NIFS-20-20 TaxID=2853806 RepID=UPI001C463DAB|nr:DciA family protein [Shewanella sp. NIFS-20-20]MBV7315763.1 DUF721 domain-containing protein [Shewanella sp. NIFS-20-20]
MKKLPQDLCQLLHGNGQLPEIAEKAELLNQLDRELKQLISGPVVDQLKVANLRHNVLVLETSAAIWATRINFQKTRLLQQLQQQTLPMLTAIEVKVNPGLAFREVEPQVNRRHISENTAHHLDALAEQAGGELGQKLKRLAALASRRRLSSED